MLYPNASRSPLRIRKRPVRLILPFAVSQFNADPYRSRCEHALTRADVVLVRRDDCASPHAGTTRWARASQRKVHRSHHALLSERSRRSCCIESAFARKLKRVQAGLSDPCSQRTRSLTSIGRSTPVCSLNRSTSVSLNLRHSYGLWRSREVEAHSIRCWASTLSTGHPLPQHSGPVLEKTYQSMPSHDRERAVLVPAETAAGSPARSQTSDERSRPLRSQNCSGHMERPPCPFAWADGRAQARASAEAGQVRSSCALMTAEGLETFCISW